MAKVLPKFQNLGREF